MNFKMRQPIDLIPVACGTYERSIATIAAMITAMTNEISARGTVYLIPAIINCGAYLAINSNMKIPFLRMSAKKSAPTVSV